LIAGMLMAAKASALPGLLVGADGERRASTTTHVVLLSHPQVSIVTVMTDVQGPIARFAVVLPVPSDVTSSRVRTVKREFVDRVEEISAPRYHEFYEMSPCEPGPAVQEWEQRLEAVGTGFLGPDVPAVGSVFEVSNDIAVPVTPVFKESENELSYRVLAPATPKELQEWMARAGYRLESGQASSLEPYLGRGRKVLVAEVDVARAELVSSSRIQLGGIRYWSREPVTEIATTLGTQPAGTFEDLFVYVLHPEQRFEALNYRNVLPPTNLLVDRDARERVGPLYNALFDRLQPNDSVGPAVAVTEFVWSTAGCGQPCPNAPLQPRELLSLGGDVVEAVAVSSSEHNAPLPPESAEQQSAFQERLLPLPPKDRVRAREERLKIRRALARRRALFHRQRYVLSRIHLRYRSDGMPRDLELGPAASHIRGGIGIPAGPVGQLSTGVESAPTSRFQVRLLALFPWVRDMACRSPERWRWGRRWPHLGHRLRKAWTGRDLPRSGRDQSLLTRVIQTSLPELGLGVPPPERPPPPREAGSPRSPSRCGCTAPASLPLPWQLAACWGLIVLGWGWRRGHRPGTAARARPAAGTSHVNDAP